MLAIVIPCFNEAKRFDVARWRVVTQSFENCHWFFVNDGSSDETGTILRGLVGENIHHLDLQANLGKGNAIRAGFNQIINQSLGTQSQIPFLSVGYMDSDGAFGLTDIELLFCEATTKLNLTSNYRTIIGSRIKLSGRQIKREALRHYLGRMINTFICFGWDNAPYDTQSGFKIFRFDQIFRDAVKQPFLTSWFFDIELILRLEALDSLGIWEIPLMEWDEVGGSQIRFSKYPSIFLQIIKIRFMVRSYAMNCRN
jgi:glycosyltransferase involved in cell wall biosynthesis